MATREDERPADEPDRARVRRVGCLLGLLVALLFGATVAWKCYMMATSR